MARTDNLRKQHAEILSIAREINEQLGAVISESDAAQIRRQLSKMHGLVGLHLAIEDKSLYPSILTSGDADARELATSYMREMGDLSLAFERHVKKWHSTALITASAAEFTEQTKAVFNALSKRIHRENTQLYPIADALA
jgi:hemerythrin-like domain-containing protein